MTEESKPAEGAVPPKVSLKKTGELSGQVPQGIPASPKRETARLDLPFEPPAAATVKKITSRISLTQPEGAAIPSPTVSGTKTIRLAPAPSKPVTSSPAPIPASAGMGDDAKRQTARIPLEAAISSQGGALTDAGATGQPKTIRIKRPGQVPSVKVAAQPAAAVADGDAVKKQTSRVEGLGVETTVAQPTQRKTIKIRRADEAASPIPRSMAVARLETEAAQRVAAETRALGKGYPWIAAAALLALCGFTYLLVMQAFPDLGWKFPGQVML